MPGAGGLLLPLHRPIEEGQKEMRKVISVKKPKALKTVPSSKKTVKNKRTPETKKKAVKNRKAPSSNGNGRKLVVSTELDLGEVRLDNAEKHINQLREDLNGLDKIKTDLEKLGQNVAESNKQYGEAIAALASAIMARRVVRVHNERTKSIIEFEGLVHKSFEAALRVLIEDGCIWLYGPAGTFKTSTSRLFAEAIFPDREEVHRFYPQSVNRQTTKSDLMGYTTADGRYVETPLYHARKFGGVFLMDEVDAANENSLTAINAAVENDVVLFPNGELVEKHHEFYVVAAGNTVGKGGDAQFVGRNVIDGATISRFPFFFFEADWGMTEVICENIAGEDGKNWALYVQMVDDIVMKLRIPHPIGPRAAVKGARLLAGGVDWKTVEELRLFGSLKPDTVDLIRAKMTKK